MGMFDTVHSSYPLIDSETDRELQCKDFDCIMQSYWISPAGQLFEVNFRHAFTCKEKPITKRKTRWDRVIWEPNGLNGFVRPDFRTCMARLYGANPKDGPWTEAFVYFKHGLIRDVTLCPQKPLSGAQKALQGLSTLQQIT